MAQQESGWFADPTGRHMYRYWDGSRWSSQVSDGGTAGVDPDALDEAAAATPPAPGTQAPGPQATTAADRPPVHEVSQRSGGSGLTGILGVLVGAIIVIALLVVLFNNAGEDDDGTATTNAPATTVTTLEVPATTAP
jgi:hypothetical protein